MDDQLDFDNVMIKPQNSNVESRQNAVITKTYKFKWTGKTIEGNPAIAANMATITIIVVVFFILYNFYYFRTCGSFISSPVYSLTI